jgi:hypothetical protein
MQVRLIDVLAKTHGGIASDDFDHRFANNRRDDLKVRRFHGNHRSV